MNRGIQIGPMVFVLRVIFFTLLLPGTVALFVPLLILVHDSGREVVRPVWSWSGLVPMSLGLGALVLCVRDFAVIGRGTPAPIDPPRELVVCGLYRYVRNPMYLGVGCMLVGESVLFATTTLLIYAAAFFVSVHLLIVLYEEPRLRHQFGESYDRYTKTVRRWLPRFSRT